MPSSRRGIFEILVACCLCLRFAASSESESDLRSVLGGGFQVTSTILPTSPGFIPLILQLMARRCPTQPPLQLTRQKRSSTTTMAQLPQLSLLPGRRRLTCRSRHLLPPAAPASRSSQGSAPRSLSHRMCHPLPTPSPWTMASGQPDSGRATGGCGRATTARPPSLTVSTVGVI